jgi:hypothetical protein
MHTGTPLPQVQEPLVVAAIYVQHGGGIGPSFDPQNAHHPVKLGYSQHLRKPVPPGISWLDDAPSWFMAGLVSDETAGRGFWPMFHEVIKHTTTINVVVDGMDVFRNPARLQVNKMTHQEMDIIIREGYVGKLHLWQNGREITGQERSRWIDAWKNIRGLP